MCNIKNYVAKHLDEPSVTVVRKTKILSGFIKAHDASVVKAQVKDGIHHTGHADWGA